MLTSKEPINLLLSGAEEVIKKKIHGIDTVNTQPSFVAEIRYASSKLKQPKNHGKTWGGVTVNQMFAFWTASPVTTDVPPRSDHY